MRKKAKWLTGLLPVIAVSVVVGAESTDPHSLPDCNVSIEVPGSHFRSAGYQRVILESNGPEYIFVPRPWPQGARVEKYVDGEWTELSVPKNRHNMFEYPPHKYEIEKHRLFPILWDDVEIIDGDGWEIIMPGRYRFVLYFLTRLPSQSKTGGVWWCRTKSEPFTLEKKAMTVHVK